MYRYYCTDRFPGNLNWTASDAKSAEDVVEAYYTKNCVFSDSDNGGEGECLLVVRAVGTAEPRYFKLWYEWNVDHSSEDYITNHHTITELKKEEVDPSLLDMLVEDRDWLKLDKYGYGRTAWPPVVDKEVAHA